MTVPSRGWALATGRVARVGGSPEVTLHWLLRVACAMCFVGHGAWGVLTKAGWLPFYGVFGIAPALAWKTMPLVGAIDIVLGLSALVWPTRAALVYMTGWAIFTALLRPAAGMGWWEFLERGGNYGPPLAFALVAGGGAAGWFGRIEPAPLAPERVRGASWVLRVSITLLLVGHGGFGLIQEKKLLLAHWHALGVPADTTFLHVIGAAEILSGVALLIHPSRALLLGIAYWKLASELLYPWSGKLRDTWEWVERGGDYLAPFALLVLLALLERQSTNSSRTTLERATGL
ncbi:MAG: hypothetical protein WDO74_15070 [Pseudomonadota bacterium]